MSDSHEFQVLVLATVAADHRDMTAAAPAFFEQMAAENGFAVTFGNERSEITEETLADVQVVVVLNVAPFDFSQEQQTAIQTFVERGGGYVGIHGAGLTGRDFMSPETPYWQWFEDLLGGVTYSPHPHYQTGTLVIEDKAHPVTQNLPDSFAIADEWYEFDHSPRGQVRILATADESSYKPNKPMGDHPMVWVNETYRRAVYIALGHDSTALVNPAFATLLRDSILWAAE